MAEKAGTIEAAPRTVAVIDIGANSVRMVVADVLPEGKIEVLERTQRAVRLGQDTFVAGRLSQKTMNAAIAILRDYRRIIDTYNVKHIHAVATSSVREAANADAFLDRVFLATNLEVEVIDPAEESRLTITAVRQALGAALETPRDKALIADIGGGSALLAVLQKGQLFASGSCQLCSFRMEEVLSTSQEPPQRAAGILRQQIANVIGSITSALPLAKVRTFVAVGGDARFAAHQVGKETDIPGVFRVDAKAFDKLVAACETHSADELARIYKLPFADVETLVPALLAYQGLLHETPATHILVPNISMREGLLLDLARSLTGQEDSDLIGSMVQSAKAIGEKYHYNAEHAQHVADLAVTLFDQLQRDHGLSPRHRLLLRIAGYLHEIGGFVSTRAHHKHSYYLIANSEIFGLRREELQIVAHVARYHRRSTPQPSHIEYMMLPREARIVVSKLAAILRVADALDRSRLQPFRDIQIERTPDELVIYVSGVPDLTLERRAIAAKGNMFEDIYGMKVRLEEAQR